MYWRSRFQYTTGSMLSHPGEFVEIFNLVINKALKSVSFLQLFRQVLLLLEERQGRLQALANLPEPAF